jgi:precorrin-6A synthase
VRRVLVIGIGAGAPEFLTVQAIAALNEVDVFLLIDKGDGKPDLLELRRRVLDRFATQRSYRVVEVGDPPRDSALPYGESVAQWHSERVLRVERVLQVSVADGECAAILVWGDPSIYDSTLRVIDEVLARGAVEFDHSVVPGISSVQVLAARHRVALNRIGRSIQITTGRLLRNGLPTGVDDVVVMLDGDNSFTTLIGHGFAIYWGAFLATPDEILIAGALDDVAGEIIRVRAEARRQKGWMFDIYLLRRVAAS